MLAKFYIPKQQRTEGLITGHASPRRQRLSRDFDSVQGHSRRGTKYAGSSRPVCGTLATGVLVPSP